MSPPGLDLNRACRAERSGRRSARQTALGREPRGAARAPLAFRGTSLDHLDPVWRSIPESEAESFERAILRNHPRHGCHNQLIRTGTALLGSSS
jgi:hypothetical protein